MKRDLNIASTLPGGRTRAGILRMLACVALGRIRLENVWTRVARGTLK